LHSRDTEFSCSLCLRSRCFMTRLNALLQAHRPLTTTVAANHLQLSRAGIRHLRCLTGSVYFIEPGSPVSSNPLSSRLAIGPHIRI
jgi:hypothetical protein